MPPGRMAASEGKPAPASPIGAVTVPPWQEGSEASVLPQSYQDLVEVAGEPGGLFTLEDHAGETLEPGQ
jgi:hypothetical protein